MREALSSNHHSHDEQCLDVVGWLDRERPDDFTALRREFPEIVNPIMPEMSAHFDTVAMGVDIEFSSWLADWIENNTPVYWEDGEPWFGESEDEEDTEQ